MITIVMLHISMSNLKGESALTINFFNHSFNTRLFFFLSGMVVVLGGRFFQMERCLELWYKKDENIIVAFRSMECLHHAIYL